MEGMPCCPWRPAFQCKADGNFVRPCLAAGAHPLLYMGIDSSSGTGVGAGEGGAVTSSDIAAAPPASAQPARPAGEKSQVGVTEGLRWLFLRLIGLQSCWRSIDASSRPGGWPACSCLLPICGHVRKHAAPACTR